MPDEIVSRALSSNYFVDQGSRHAGSLTRNIASFYDQAYLEAGKPKLELPHDIPADAAERRENEEARLAYAHDKGLFFERVKYTHRQYVSFDVKLHIVSKWNELKPQGSNEATRSYVCRIMETREFCNMFAALPNGNIENMAQIMGPPPVSTTQRIDGNVQVGEDGLPITTLTTVCFHVT